MNQENKKPAEEASTSMEREHMFDKVVTPSDVGKLNRLVIPKQHAERYFPLDNSSTNTKGLLLDFEDRTGNSWRFRYSYWNSSQSYVMTKGWSRFVKDKKLDAGDIVSFQRDPCNKDKLYIDWRRRPKIPDHHHQFAGAMFPRFYSFPHPQMPTSFETSHNLYHRFQRDLGVGYYVRSMEGNDPTAVIESVPVIMQRREAQVGSMASSRGEKRLRLFGVDMECRGGGGGGSVNSTEEESSSSGGSMSRGGGSMAGVGSLLQLRLVSSDDESLVAMEAASVDEDHHLFTTKKGKSSLSFDLDRCS
ncbi:unnamed protein product [Eruca vesicaria subsp. sativa]|uniref:TF-B3 domain-containing protein n=1 Tax=Eruca vesicaria subsp. sativa TaxID=29727 RepID=A0ABC8JD57_ERUVS|nr:unnamed protein product [Eruca vesicaria subsp. sativa]